MFTVDRPNLIAVGRKAADEEEYPIASTINGESSSFPGFGPSGAGPVRCYTGAWSLIHCSVHSVGLHTVYITL